MAGIIQSDATSRGVTKKIKSKKNAVQASRALGAEALSSISKTIKALLDDNKISVAKDMLCSLHYSDQIDLLCMISRKHMQMLIESLGQDINYNILTDGPDKIVDTIMETIGIKGCGKILAKASVTDVVNFLGDFSSNDISVAKMLKEIPENRRKTIRKALSFSENAAGRHITSEYLVVPITYSVKDVLKKIKSKSSADTLRDSEIYDIFVVDEDNKLVGTTTSTLILRESEDRMISEILNKNFFAVDANESMENVLYFFNKYDPNTMPVVGSNNEIIGIISIDDIRYISNEKEETDKLRMSGVFRDPDGSSMLGMSRDRLAWLFVNLITATLASWVLSFFEHEIEKITALAILMPIGISMGCNAGTQTTAVIIRAIALKQINKHNFGIFLGREIIMVCINSILLGLLCTLGATLVYGKAIGLVFGISIIATIMVGVLSGFFSPILMKKLNTDPALTSVILVTTVTDIFAFGFFLGLAKVFLIK